MNIISSLIIFRDLDASKAFYTTNITPRISPDFDQKYFFGGTI
jgi:hypothetical protein